jgi:hypothetical protein
MKPIVYPDSDHRPIAEHTLQFDWIVQIHACLECLFDDNPNIFVAADLLWYPVPGKPKIRTGPDVMVAFGRPNGYRSSLKCNERRAGSRPRSSSRSFRPASA